MRRALLVTAACAACRGELGSVQLGPPPVEEVPAVGVRDSGGQPGACDDPELERRTRFVDAWPQRVSCLDRAVLSPRTQDVRLYVEVDRGAEPVVPGTATWALDEAHPGLTLRVQQGRSLSAGTCAGWLYPGIDATVDATWDPVEGTLTFTVDGIGSGRSYQGTVRWTGLVVEATDGSGKRCAVPDATFAGLSFGDGGPLEEAR